jgi:hypothetical protein
MEGWVKLHRRISQNELWLSEPFTDGQAWVDLIMLANHKNGFIKARGIRYEIKRGEIGWSEVKLSERWRWSRGKTRRFLKFLENKNMIKIVQQNFKLSTIISITNYDEYQGNDTTNDTTNGQQTIQQTDTNKNDKKKKNVKNNIFVPPTIDEVKQYFKDNNYKEDVAIRAFNHYDVSDWYDSKGNKVKNWKQKMIGVWFKDENKKPIKQLSI